KTDLGGLEGSGVGYVHHDGTYSTSLFGMHGARSAEPRARSQGCCAGQAKGGVGVATGPIFPAGYLRRPHHRDDSATPTCVPVARTAAARLEISERLAKETKSQ